MKIKLIWPQYKFVSDEMKLNDDALFLECSLEETKKQIFEFLTDEQIKEILRSYRPIQNQEHLEFGIETDKICFLVSKDLTVFLPRPWFFPYSGQWNAYNPFRKIKEIEIKDISEIGSLVLEIETDDIS